MRLYHNPRCSKSRAALDLLLARGLKVDVVEYLTEPPSPGQLHALLSMLALSPRDLVRTGEAEYTALGLDAPGVSDDVLIDAMATHPRLIERPVFVCGEHAVIGRPPERVLELLDAAAR